jgi:hypothetical protein
MPRKVLKKVTNKSELNQTVKLNYKKINVE